MTDAPAEPVEAARRGPDYSNSPVLAAAAPTTSEYPFPADRGVHVVDEQHGPGWYGVYLTPTADGLRSTMVISFAAWSASFELTSGQRHRLSNALTGRGKRQGVRPTLAGTEDYVHLTATHRTLSVDTGTRQVDLPTGPKRMLANALDAPEAFEPFRAGGLPADGGSLTIAPPTAD